LSLRSRLGDGAAGGGPIEVSPALLTRLGLLHELAAEADRPLPPDFPVCIYLNVDDDDGCALADAVGTWQGETARTVNPDLVVRWPLWGRARSLRPAGRRARRLWRDRHRGGPAQRRPEAAAAPNHRAAAAASHGPLTRRIRINQNGGGFHAPRPAPHAAQQNSSVQSPACDRSLLSTTRSARPGVFTSAWSAFSCRAQRSANGW
jgi:hypothetical protein